MNEVYRSSSDERSRGASHSHSRSRSRGSIKALRDRSVGSNGSGREIAQIYSGPKQGDPNRYMKYLSLRNRKVVEPYHQQRGLDTGESSMGNSTAHLTSQEDRESTAQLGEKILVDRGDIRNGASPLRQKTRSPMSRSSKSSMKDEPRFSAGNRDVRQRQSSQSPLRVKTLSAGNSKESLPSHHRHAKENKWTPTDAQAGRIPVYSPESTLTQERPGSHERHEMPPPQEQFASTQPKITPTRPKKSAKSKRGSTEFGVSTNDDEADFHFDFDQDADACSYVNTTMQSHPSEERRSLEMPQPHKDARRSPNRRPPSGQMGSIPEASKESYHGSTDHETQRALQGQSKHDESEDSSGYVVDYEQMLKDSKEERKEHEQKYGGILKGMHMPTTGFREHDIGQQPILEQTQANETSNENSAERSPKFVDSQRVNLNLQNRQAEPKYRPKQPDSPGSDINSVNSVNIDTNNHRVTDYRFSPERVEDYQNHRRGGSGGNGSQGRNNNMQMRRSSSERDRFRDSCLAESRLRDSKDYDRALKAKGSYKSKSRESIKNDGDTGPTFRDPEIAKGAVPLSQQENEYFMPLKQRETPDDSDEQEPRSPSDCEYDLTGSNKRMRKQAEEVLQQSAKLCKGSEGHESNLVVACIIRHTPSICAGGASRSRSPVGQTMQRRASPHSRKGRNPDYQPYQMRSSRSNASYGSSIRALAGGGNSLGAINRLNRSGFGLDVSTTSASGRSGRRKKRGSSFDAKRQASGSKRKSKSTIKPPSSNPQLLTTHVPSKYLVRGPPGLQSSLLKILLKAEQDVYNCQQAFEEGTGLSKTRKSMKVFEFDNCIGETNGHSISIGLQQHVQWITSNKHDGGKKRGTEPKNVVLLFGQTDALKQQLLNIVQPDSLISQCLQRKDIKFLRVSMFHLGQEYLLAHRTFGTKVQMRREIGMEIREAYRERDLNAKKIALKLSTYLKQVKAEEVKLSSHLMVQLDNLVFFDLADIDNLKDQGLAKRISADFSAVTNAILSLSPFYKDHSFGGTESDALSPYKETNSFRTGSLSFKSTIASMLTRHSRILLICCVTPSSMAGTQAVDYCHKIAAYFKGQTDDTQSALDISTQIKNPGQGDVSLDTENHINAFRQLGGLISEVQKTRAFIDKMFAAKRAGERVARDSQQLKEMVEALRDDVGELLSNLAAHNESYVPQFTQIKRLLQKEILHMNDTITGMRSASRGKNSGGGANAGNSTIAFLPKGINPSSVNIVTAKSQVQTPKGGQNVHQRQSLHQRPRSQTNFSQDGPKERSGHKNCQGCHHEHPQATESGQISREGSRADLKTGSQKSLKQVHRPAAVARPYQEKRPQSQGLRQSQNSNSSFNQQRKPHSLNRSANQRNSSQGPIPQRRSRQSTPQNQRTKHGIFPILRPKQQETQVTNDTSKLSHSRALSKSSAGSTGKLNKNKSMQRALKNLMKDNTANNDLSMVDSRVKEKVRQLQQDSANNMKEVNEMLHQEMEALRAQVFEANAALENERVLRQSREERLMEVEDGSAVLEQKFADLEDRIIAKDQTIRSLEAQVDFLKSTKRAASISPKRREQSAEMRELRRQKGETDEINRQILGQIGILKDAIQGFQNQEKFNKKLLMAQKKKDRELKEMQEQIKQVQQQTISNTQDRRSPHSRTHLSSSYPTTYGHTQNTVGTLDSQRATKNQSDMLQDMRAQLEHLQRQKDQYRDQSFALKNELRRVKEYASRTTDGSSANNLLRDQYLQSTQQSQQKQHEFDHNRNLRNRDSQSRSRERKERSERQEHQERLERQERGSYDRKSKSRSRDRERERSSGHDRDERVSRERCDNRENTSSNTLKHTQHTEISNSTQQQSLYDIKSMIKEFRDEKRPALLRPSSSRDLRTSNSSSCLNTGHSEKDKHGESTAQSYR